MNAQDQIHLDIQGHRGCRGLMPENTIEAFVHAIKLGVNTLEFDVVISKDNKVIVSHEPYMNHLFCFDSQGKVIDASKELDFNLFEMTYEEIKSYDVGSKIHPVYPNQTKIKTYKPSLNDVITAVKAISDNISFNIEIKRKKKWDKIFHPEFKVFADLVINELNALKIIESTTVQCFDVETLQYINDKYPSVKLVYLVENFLDIEANIKKLGFFPCVYSPWFKLISLRTVEYCKENKIQLIPWTVNEKHDMTSMINLGVDGIITDFPDRLIEMHAH